MRELIDIIKDDVRSAMRMRASWRVLLVWAIVCESILWPLHHAGRRDLELPILASIVVIGVAFKIKWRLRRSAWFWITMAVIVVAHVALIATISWTPHWIPAVVTASVASGDLVVILTILAVVQSVTQAARTKN
jgi:hypothetical protein